jgi:hypothetical protein
VCGGRRAACGGGSGQEPESSVQSAEAVQNPESSGRVGVMGARALARLSSGRGCGLRVVGGKLFADSRASGGADWAAVGALGVQSRRTKQSQEASKRRSMLRCDATNGESTEYRVAVTLAEDVWSGLSHAGWDGWLGSWLAALVGVRPGVTATKNKNPCVRAAEQLLLQLHCQTTAASRQPPAASRQHRRASPGSSRLFLRLWLATLHHSQTDTIPACPGQTSTVPS